MMKREPGIPRRWEFDAHNEAYQLRRSTPVIAVTQCGEPDFALWDICGDIQAGNIWLELSINTYYATARAAIEELEPVLRKLGILK